MRKSIANISLTLLLMTSVVSLAGGLLSQLSGENTAYQLTLPGDGEDQEDDSSPSNDNETDQDNSILIEKYLLRDVPLLLKERDPMREQLFMEHDSDVGTPPPKQ